MGQSDFNEPSVNPLSNTSIVCDAAAHPYVVYRTAYGATGQVRMFNGTTWELVGNPGITLNAFGADFFIMMDAAGIPTLVYQEGLSNSKASVKKFIGGNWVQYGTKLERNSKKI